MIDYLIIFEALLLSLLFGVRHFSFHVLVQPNDGFDVTNIGQGVVESISNLLESNLCHFRLP